MSDYNDLIDQINEPNPQANPAIVSISGDSGLRSSISGAGVDAGNPDANELYIQENKQPQHIHQGVGLNNESYDEAEQDIGIGDSISRTRSSEFVPEIIEFGETDPTSETFDSVPSSVPYVGSEHEKYKRSMLLPNAAFPAAVANLSDPETIKHLVATNQSERLGISSFDHAIIRNDASAVKALLERGADPNIELSHPLRCLLNRLIKDPVEKEVNLEMIDSLLKFGANVNQRLGTGFSPLHLAVKHCYNSLNLAKLLIQYGADVNAKVWPGNKKPLDMCIDDKTKEFLKTYEALLNKEGTLRDPNASVEELEAINQKKQNLLKINEKLIPLNTRLVEREMFLKKQAEQQEPKYDNENQDNNNLSKTLSGLKGYFNK